jgi:hypothetical protein
MSTKQTEALKLALEALEMVDRDDNDRDFLMPAQCYRLDEAITAIREALAEQPAQQEPQMAHCAGDLMPKTLVYTAKQVERMLAEHPARQQEPVAHVYLFDPNGRPRVAWDNAKDIKIGDKLYTSPPASKPWVGLTDEDRYKAIRPLYNSDENARLAVEHSNDEYEAIEAKLREKNA